MWAADNIAHTNMLLYPLYYNIISLRSLKITQAFHLLLGFAENQGVFWDFKIQNSVRITKGSDNGDSDNPGSTVLEIQTSIGSRVKGSWAAPIFLSQGSLVLSIAMFHILLYM